VQSWCAATSERPVWTVGHWGLQAYADEVGWRPIEPGSSRVAAGDWLVVPRDRDEARLIVIPANARRVHVESAESRWPWRTLHCYYGMKMPIQPMRGAIVTLDVYRIADDGVIERGPR
jgi:hypothetical protein